MQNKVYISGFTITDKIARATVHARSHCTFARPYTFALHACVKN